MKDFKFDHTKIKRSIAKPMLRPHAKFSDVIIDFKAMSKVRETTKLKLDCEIGIYKAECLINKSIYIGQSKNIPSRIKTHKRNLNSLRYKDSHPRFQNDYFEYGEANFIFEPIHNCEEHELLQWETYFIEYYINEGYTVYNIVLDTTDQSLVNCPGKYVEIVTKLVRQLETGKISQTDLEKALYYSENY